MPTITIDGSPEEIEEIRGRLDRCKACGHIELLHNSVECRKTRWSYTGEEVKRPKEEIDE